MAVQIRWNVRCQGGDVSEATFVLKKGGLTELTTGAVTLSDGQGKIEAELDEPGWLLAEVSVKPAADSRVRALAGALVSPEKIRPALPRPDDFDTFWDAKLGDLAAVVVNPKLDAADIPAGPKIPC